MKQVENKQFDLVLVGGGCSSFAFLLNAYRNNQLEQLAGKNGICIIEKSEKFGGGTLEDNLIPSNTHSIGLLRYIMREYEADMLPTHFERYLKEDLPQLGKRPNFDLTKIDKGILPIFDEFKDTAILNNIKKISEQTSSLQMFGYFLRLAGNSFLRTAQEKNMNITFLPNSQCSQFSEKQNDFYKIGVQNAQNPEQESQIYAKNILMATGGHQKHHSMYDIVPQQKRILCQDFLKQTGFLRALELIEQNPDAPISVIGGSHSGFSVAYMLIYGPDCYSVDELLQTSEYSKKRNIPCPICNQIGLNCKCYGDITPAKLHEKILNYKTKLQEGQVKIFHRHNFRLSFATKEIALQEKYQDFDENCVHKQEGCVNPYTGLRGLTKKLYEDVMSKKEKRIQFVKFSQVEEIQHILDQSSVVVECLGYYSNLIPYNQQQNNFEYTLDTDKFCKMDKNTHNIEGFSDVWGSGLGYGLQTHDELIGGELLVEKKVRADSLQVYLSRLSSKIISGMLQTKNQ